MWICSFQTQKGYLLHLHKLQRKALPSGLMLGMLTCNCGRASKLSFSHFSYGRQRSKEAQWRLCVFSQLKPHTTEVRYPDVCSRTQGSKELAWFIRGRGDICGFNSSGLQLKNSWCCRIDGKTESFKTQSGSGGRGLRNKTSLVS